MFDAYHKWLAIPPGRRPPTHYQLLGVAPTETDADVLREAAIRQTTHLRTYQSGSHAEECARLLNEVAQSRKTLLDPEARRAYDASLAGDQHSPASPGHARPHHAGPSTGADALQKSLQLVLDQEDGLADRFYFTVFLKRYPELAAQFEGVDFHHQAVLLAMALLVMVYHFQNPCPATRLYLRHLGKKHHARNIPRESYAKFRDALLETLKHLHGKDWTEPLAAQWRSAIESATTEMLRSEPVADKTFELQPPSKPG